jgi:hypothetical protein
MPKTAKNNEYGLKALNGYYCYIFLIFTKVFFRGTPVIVTITYILAYF